MTTRKNSPIYIDCFDSTGGLPPKRRYDYETVKATVLVAGRYSIFEATGSDRAVNLFSRLRRDPELEFTEMGYPWTGVQLKTEKSA